VASGVEVPAFAGGVLSLDLRLWDGGVSEDLLARSGGGVELVVPVAPDDPSDAVWASPAVSHGSENVVVGVVCVAEVPPDLWENVFDQGFAADAFGQEFVVETGMGEKKPLGEVGESQWQGEGVGEGLLKFRGFGACPPTARVEGVFDAGVVLAFGGGEVRKVVVSHKKAKQMAIGVGEAELLQEETGFGKSCAVVSFAIKVVP
jgi:hypothetical protein